MSRFTTAFGEPDLHDLLADDPGLLAIADAIAATQRRTRTRAPARLLALAAVVAAACVAVLAAPWQPPGQASLLERALAAVGDGVVIHAVLERPAGVDEVDLASGTVTPLQRRYEVWLDSHRGGQHTRVSVGGVVEDDILQTPEGGDATAGSVYTCAWVQAHPIGARNAGVSCKTTGASATAFAPDPALSMFADGYRQGLANGSARISGHGRIDGHSVSWISFADSRVEQVAVDEQTALPLAVESRSGTGASYRVVSIETLPPGDGDLAVPTSGLPATPTFGNRDSAEPVSAAAAVAAVPGAVIPGATLAGLPLEGIVLTRLQTTFAFGRPPLRDVGVELRYGSGRAAVVIQEATTAQMAYGWFNGLRPRPGTMLSSWYGSLLVRDGLYVSIRGGSFEQRFAIARAVSAATP